MWTKILFELWIISNDHQYGCAKYIKKKSFGIQTTCKIFCKLFNHIYTFTYILFCQSYILINIIKVFETKCVVLILQLCNICSSKYNMSFYVIKFLNEILNNYFNFLAPLNISSPPPFKYIIVYIIIRIS